jgi:undecaprenyl-diphosphatase
VNFFYAVILGIIQGLTEFLPISSTAHLTLAGKLIGSIDVLHPESWTAFIAVMQLGTLTAVVVYFWKDFMAMIVAVVRGISSGTLRGPVRTWPQDARLALGIFVGTLPVALIGYSLHKIIEGALTKSIPVIVGSLVVLALLLWFAERVAQHKRSLGELTVVDALLIGIAQVLALIPGSSRSGTTITAGLFLGLTRETAARFSFLLSVPAVFASGLYEMVKIYQMSRAGTELFTLGIGNLVIATVVSAVVGYAAIAWLLRYLVRHTTLVFVWYRLALGLLLALLLLTGFILP